MPTTGFRVRSATLEEPLSLVARDNAVEQLLFGASVVEIVLDDVVAERGTSDRPALKRPDRLAQRRWEPLRVGDVRVPLERRPRVELLLDPVQARRDQCREREIRVDVAAGDPRLDAQPAAVADDQERTRPVVAPPRKGRRRPRAGREAFVRVHVRREEQRELASTRDLTRQILPEDLRLAGERAVV